MQGVEDERAVLIEVPTEGKAQLDMDGILHLLKQGITDFLGKNPFDQFILVMEVVVEALAVHQASAGSGTERDVADHTVGEDLHRRNLPALLIEPQELLLPLP